MFDLIYKNCIALIALTFIFVGGAIVANAQPTGKIQKSDITGILKKGGEINYDKEINDKADKLAQDLLSENGGKGAVVIGVIDGNKRLIYSYGETANGNGQKPNPKTLFQIGSITKTFTGTLLADLKSKNLVQYSDPLEAFVPNGTSVPKAGNRKISLLDLATHTSGLPRKIPNISFPTAPPEAYSFLNTYIFESGYAPGGKWRYSNLGFGLLGLALAKADPATPNWKTLVEKVINQPLGMDDTKIDLTAQQSARRAQGYDNAGNMASWEMDGFPAMSAAGALYSTGDDMVKYLSFNMELTQTPLNSLLADTQKSWRSIDDSTTKFAGLGWQITEGKNRKVWKDGATNGFNSYIGFCKEKKVGVIVLTNSRKLSADPTGTKLYNYLTKDSTDPEDISDDSE